MNPYDTRLTQIKHEQVFDHRFFSHQVDVCYELLEFKWINFSVCFI